MMTRLFIYFIINCYIDLVIYNFLPGLFFYLYICFMAEAIKSIRRISKKLQETFKTICFYTARHLSKSQKYKGQFLDQYKKIANKLRNDAKKTQVKDLKKHKEQKQKLKKQLTQLKQKRKNEEKQKQQRKVDRGRRSSSQQSYDKKDKYEIKANKKNEKQKQRKNNDKAQPKKNMSILQKQRELDFDRDFDFKSYHREPNYGIYEQEEDDNIKSIPKKKKQQQRIGWNVKQMERIGSSHPQKYKIMKISEQTSDFQDENAPEKVPAIKPREPLTPYFLFLRYNRFSIAQSYPNIEKNRSFARIWKQLPEQQRATYQQEYRRSQQIYAKKLVQFYAVNPRSIQQKHKIRQQIERAAKMEPKVQKKQTNKKSLSKYKKQEKQDDEYQPKQGKPKPKPQKRQPRKKKAEQ